MIKKIKNIYTKYLVRGILMATTGYWRFTFGLFNSSWSTVMVGV